MVAIGSLFALVSWGWLVLMAIFGRELAQRVRGLTYSLCLFFQSAVGGWPVQYHSTGTEYAEQFSD